MGHLYMKLLACVMRFYCVFILKAGACLVYLGWGGRGATFLQCGSKLLVVASEVHGNRWSFQNNIDTCLCNTACHASHLIALFKNFVQIFAAQEMLIKLFEAIWP